MAAGLIGLALDPGGLIMVVIGSAGLFYGLRTLRPQVSGVEEYLRAREGDEKPSPWSNFFAAGSTVFALFALLIGIMLFMFGLWLILLK